jgi:hypothetical protein
MKRKRIIPPEAICNRLSAMGLLTAAETLCLSLGTTVLEAFRGKHEHRQARARAMVWGTLYRFTDLSYPEIGKLTGYDHSTIWQQIGVHCLEWRERSEWRPRPAITAIEWQAQDGDAVGLGATGAGGMTLRFHTAHYSYIGDGRVDITRYGCDAQMRERGGPIHGGHHDA